MSAQQARPSGSAAPLEGERKPVTALFADLVGSTRLAEGLDPEDWAVIVNRMYEVTSAAITRYDGTITQLSGDAIVAIFGAPVAHEDDPERAVRAAFDLIAAVEELARDMRDEIGTDLEMRVGVNTGLAVVGSVGGDSHEEYTALGDAMNVAARMESAAEPGTVLITASTYEHVADLVEVVDRGGLEVKGKSEPVAAYEVTSIREGVTRTRGIPGLESPMVGRTEELERITELLDLVRAGRGRAALIIGEPGIGKSRLLAELRTHDGELRWLEGRCLSYGRSLPHHLIVDLLASMAGSDGEVGSDDVERLVASVLDEQVEETTAHLQHLLGLPTPPEIAARLADLDPTAVRRRHVDALNRVLSAMARSTPLALVCEDLHWADASSVDVLEELARIVHRCPVLLLGTARPYRESEGWRFVSQARSELGDALTELRLDALSRDDSRALVANLLEIESLPGDVRQLILERTDGNPFFVEEVIRSLIDEGLIVRRGERWVASGDLTTVDVPESIQGLLLGRIDRLPDDARRALRVASVLGRTFTAELLDTLTDGPLDAHAELGTLEAHGLVSITATRPQMTYSFRHALVQEAAYSGLLKRERQTLHRRVADVLEEQHAEHPEEVAALLAHHLDLAGEHDRAIPHLIEAGEQALARYANREAQALFARASEVLADRTEPEWVRPRVEALVGRSDAGTKWVPVDQARALLEAALPEAEELGDERLLARIHLGFAELYYYDGDLGNPELHAALERAHELGERLGDDTFIALPLSLHAQMAAGGGQYREAIASATRAVEILERREVFADAGFAAGYAAMAHAWLGEFDEAARWLDRQQVLVDESGDPNAILDADLHRGIVESERGNFEEAISFTRSALEQAEEVGNLECSFAAMWVLGDQHLRMGDVDAAVPVLERSGEIAAYCKAPGAEVTSHAWLAAARSRVADDLQSELRELEESLETIRSFGMVKEEAELLLHRATVLAAQPGPDWDAVTDDFDAAVGMLKEIHARPALARTLHDYGMALEVAGRSDEATEKLERAAVLADEMGLAPAT